MGKDANSSDPARDLLQPEFMPRLEFKSIKGYYSSKTHANRVYEKELAAEEFNCNDHSSRKIEVVMIILADSL